MKVTFLILIFLAVIVGCSNRGAYTGIQTSNRFECSKRPPPSQYDECMESALRTPYLRAAVSQLSEALIDVDEGAAVC